MTVGYRVRYNASSNISFHNELDAWERWHDEEASRDDVLSDLSDGEIQIPPAMDIALERSGFEWWVEVREVSS